MGHRFVEVKLYEMCSYMLVVDLLARFHQHVVLKVCIIVPISLLECHTVKLVQPITKSTLCFHPTFLVFIISSLHLMKILNKY